MSASSNWFQFQNIEELLRKHIALRFERARQTKTDKTLNRPIQPNTMCAWMILFVKPETFFQHTRFGFVYYNFFLVNRHRKSYCVWSRECTRTYIAGNRWIYTKNLYYLYNSNRLFGIDFIFYRSQSFNSAITISIIQLWYVCKSDGVIVGVSIGLIKF